VTDDRRDSGEPRDAGDARDDEREDQAADELRRSVAAAAERSGLGRIARDETLKPADLVGALGGVRGLAEAILPGLVFLVIYTFTRELVWALTASLGLAVVFTVARLVTRSQPTQAIAGLIGAGASAALALWTGRAEDNYVLGFYLNAVYAIGILVSLLVRWPLVGIIVGFLKGDGTAWRHRKRIYRAMQFLTLVWLGMFVARIVVQLPFYFAGNVEALGATRLLMGVPLYALLLVFSWLVVRAVYPAKPTVAE
jgi:hypothetical protein